MKYTKNLIVVNETTLLLATHNNVQYFRFTDTFYIFRVQYPWLGIIVFYAFLRQLKKLLSGG